MRTLLVVALLCTSPVFGQETKIPVYFNDPVVGPPAPKDPAIVLIEARLEEVRRVADGTFLDAAIIAPGLGFDLWTTGRCEGCRELNPLIANSKGYPDALKATGLKAAVGPLEVGACYVLRRQGHHNWARGLAIGLTVFHAAVGIHNLRTGGVR